MTTTDIHAFEGHLDSPSVRVSFEFIDEGLNGDYDPDDARDIPLLRLDCLVRAGLDGVEGEETGIDGWLYPQDGSICTMVAATTTIEIQRQYLEYALERLSAAVESGGRVKRVMEELSWMGDRPSFS